jgi:hypothetical protein
LVSLNRRRVSMRGPLWLVAAVAPDGRIIGQVKTDVQDARRRTMLILGTIRRLGYTYRDLASIQTFQVTR